MLEAAHIEAMAIDSAFGSTPTYESMTVTVAIVQKRHNTRFFHVSATLVYLMCIYYIDFILKRIITFMLPNSRSERYFHFRFKVAPWQTRWPEPSWTTTWRDVFGTTSTSFPWLSTWAPWRPPTSPLLWTRPVSHQVKQSSIAKFESETCLIFLRIITISLISIFNLALHTVARNLMVRGVL